MLKQEKLEKKGTGIGVDLRGCSSFDDMLRKSQTNWTAEKVPLYTQDGVQVEDAYAIKRTTDGKILCPNVSSRYKVFNQEDFGPLADSLISLGAKPIRGDGFYGGKRVWYQFEWENKNILGDEHKHFVYLTNSYDKAGAVTIATSMLRIICSNAINMMLKSATNRWSYAHLGDINGKIDEASRVMLLSEKYADVYEKEAEKLSAIPVDDGYVSDFIDKIIPIPKKEKDENDKSYLFRLARAESARIEINRIYKEKEDLKDMKNSKLKVLQSVSDYLSHPAFSRTRKDTEEMYAYKQMLGSSMLTKTYNLLVA